MAGGVRRGPSQGEVGRLDGRRPGAARTRRSSPCWEGRHPGGRAASGRRGRARGGRLPARPVRPDRRRAAGRSPRASSTRTRTCCSPGTREDELVLRQQRRVVPRHPRGRRRHPLDGRRDPGRVGGGAAGPRPALARRDARPRRHDGRGQVGLRPGPRDRAAAARGRLPAGPRGPDRRRPDLARRPRRPAGVPGPARRHRGVRPLAHRGPAARHRGPRPGALRRRLLRDGRVHAPTSRGGSSRRPRALGLLPRLHADELAPSGGAELAAELGAASADHLATPSADGIAAMAAAADAGEPVVATLLPVTTWFLMKDHHAPARAFIDAGVPVAIGTDFNPGTSPTPSLPLAMSFACVNLRHVARRGPGRGDDQRRPGPRPGGRDRLARAGQGRRPRRSGGCRRRPRSRTGRAPTSCGPSSSAAGSSSIDRDRGRAAGCHVPLCQNRRLWK